MTHRRGHHRAGPDTAHASQNDRPDQNATRAPEHACPDQDEAAHASEGM